MSKNWTSDEIEAEVKRLAPWYHDFDLHGVKTSSTPACDRGGHRTIVVPEVYPGFWHGREVLDVACADGAWSFGAAKWGARSVHAFDCRPENVAKGKFVKALWGMDQVSFSVHTCDSWYEEHPERMFDTIMMPGVLYHLPDPPATIAQYCRLAKDTILVSCQLTGGSTDGYDHLEEFDNLAASYKSLPSLMPRTVNTLIAEFGRHGFYPTHVRHTGGAAWHHGCGFLAQSARHVQGFRPEKVVGAGEDLDIYLAAMPTPAPGERRAPFDIRVVAFNQLHKSRRLAINLRLQSASGEIKWREDAIGFELAARPERGDLRWSESQEKTVELDLHGVAGPSFHAELVDADSGAVLASNSAALPDASR